MGKIVINWEYESWQKDIKLNKQRVFEPCEFFKFCPYCASSRIYYEPDSEVDYGGGELHVCLDCAGAFYGYTANDRTKLAQELIKALA